MAIFKNLRNLGKQMAAGFAPTPLTEEQLAALPPEQREAYEAALAEVAAGQRQLDAIYDSQMAARALHGPAGLHVYGADPREIAEATNQALATGGLAAYMKASWKATGPGGGEPPTPTPSNGLPVDPATRPQEEWQRRQEARAPYLAPSRFPVTFTRIATRASTQIDDVAAHLTSSGLAARPELVFGLYPVPDHIGHGMGRSKNRYIEWDVVHAASEPLPPASNPGFTFLPGNFAWVARSSGEQSVLDEDLAITMLASAGLGPEHCLGIARIIATADRDGGDDSAGYTAINVTGAAVFGHPSLGDHSRDALAGAAPMSLPVGAPAGVHVEVLNWHAIAQAVHPDSQSRPPVPSPFPYLPGTPQELIRSYLDIVGVNPFDSYAASVTEDTFRDLRTLRRKGFMQVNTNTSTSLPCVDGESRMRMFGGSLVVVAYRDRPDYVTGRQRWAAYERDVLQSQLSQGTGARRPVTPMAFGSLGRGTRQAIRWAEIALDTVSYFVDDASSDQRGDRQPHRYCWPPTDIR